MKRILTSLSATLFCDASKRGEPDRPKDIVRIAARSIVV
jgi:hypothetical protein